MFAVREAKSTAVRGILAAGGGVNLAMAPPKTDDKQPHRSTASTTRPRIAIRILIDLSSTNTSTTPNTTMIYRTCVYLGLSLSRLIVSFIALSPFALPPAFAIDIDYHRYVAPILRTYCAGCHNDAELEGDFSVSSLDALLRGTPTGRVIIAGDPSASKLMQVVTANDESVMPPKGEPRPSTEEIDLLQRWIAQGAQGNAGQWKLADQLKTPQLNTASENHHYIGAACLISDELIAIGSMGSVELRNTHSSEVLWKNLELPGKVNSIRLSTDGDLLIVGGGIAGLGGEITLLDAKTGATNKRLQGHSDSVYCASISPDGRWIASGSYDRNVILWDASSGEVVREFQGHNGAVYDLDFDPSSRALATASGDQTVKLWNIATGSRLDTFGQPEGEMLCVRFSADGAAVFAGGADRQIRKWRILSLEKPTINPMTLTCFAHESEVLQLQLLDNEQLISSSRDKKIKLWRTESLAPLGVIGQTADLPIALCVAKHSVVDVVDLAGNRQHFSADALQRLATNPLQSSEIAATMPDSVPSKYASVNNYHSEEPNDTLETAIPIVLPAEISGHIAPENPIDREDEDLYQFHAQAGQTWIFEVTAARDQSKLDSRIDILDAQGMSVLRTRLQAVRESYLTFRGKDSNTVDDFRLHKWEEMELDEFLLASGEVVRLWLYPRGPDSGFKVYPGAGSRNTFFDTTPVAHALGEPAYIVRELQPGETPLPNGLPVFPIYYENDDDAQRRFGSDSRLTFVAPQDGIYYLRIRDARSFGGPEYVYKLSARVPDPHFTTVTSATTLDIPLGGGREWSITASRFDGLNGPITVELQGLPDGLIATNPVTIEAGQITAIGTIFANELAATHITSQASDSGTTAVTPPQDQPPAEALEVRMIATADVNGVIVTQELPHKLTLTISPPSGLRFKLVDNNDTKMTLNELTIRPGQTISARIVLERNGVEGPISFGNEDSGRGLPHGAYVDNIGLNGLLIPADQNEREFYITAAPKVTPGRYPFHLRSTNGNVSSYPIWLNVVVAE